LLDDSPTELSGKLQSQERVGDSGDGRLLQLDRTHGLEQKSRYWHGPGFRAI